MNQRDTRQIIIKMAKVKHKNGILKAVREKQTVTYKVNPIRLSSNLKKIFLKYN